MAASKLLCNELDFSEKVVIITGFESFESFILFLVFEKLKVQIQELDMKLR
jgi:hypothetical protein